MVLAIIFAHVWGVVQLIILGSLARTVRLRTVFLAMAVGLYACPPVAVLLQVAWTRPAAWLTGASLSDVVGTASYTVDPFIEQIILLLPLTVLLSTIPSIRRQWSITDCVLTSAAVGSGFGLAEALYRYSTSADQAYRSASDAGWTLAATSIGDVLNPRWIPGAWYSLTSWFPAGAPLGVNNYYVNIGLAYGAIVGLGVGLMMLHRRMLARMVGAVLLLYTAVDHATINAWLRDVLSAPLTSGHMLGLMSIAALAVALWLDHGRQRIGDSIELLLAAEQSVPQRPLGTLRAAVSRLPWSLTWVNGFVRMRRAYTSARASEPAEPDNLRATVVHARDRVDEELAQVESPPLLPISWLETLRRPAIIGWLVLMTPCVLWFVVGGRPATAWVQDTMITGPVWIAVLVFSVATQVWLAWSVIVGVRTWQKARWLPLGDDAAVTGLRIACGIGAIGLGAYALLRALLGDSPADAILNAHTQEAISDFGLGPAIFLGNGLGVFTPPPTGGGAGGAGAGTGTGGGGRTGTVDPEHRPNPKREMEREDERARERVDKATRHEEDALREAGARSAAAKAVHKAAEDAHNKRVKAGDRYKRSSGRSAWQAAKDYYAALAKERRLNRAAQSADAAFEAAKNRVREAEAEADEAAADRDARGWDLDDQRADEKPDKP